MQAAREVDALSVVAPFPGRAVWAIDPPRIRDDDGGARILVAAERAFPDARCMLVRSHGSTGTQQVSSGRQEVEDDGSSPEGPGGPATLLDRLAAQLDVPDLSDIVNGIDLRPDVLHVPLDEVDAARLGAHAAALVAAMGPDPKVPRFDIRKLEPAELPGRDEVAAARAAEPGRAEAEAADAARLRVLGLMLLAILVMGVVFAVLARRQPSQPTSEPRQFVPDDGRD